MVKLPVFFAGASRKPAARHAPPIDSRASEVQLEMGSALVLGLDQRNTGLRFIEHSARVSELVGRLADAFSLDDSERKDLDAAARLHEIGMISVPTELMESPAPLDEMSLAQLRSQASVGAEILRPRHSARTCMLVKHQYTHFDEIRLRFRPDSRDVLLAGLFRAADALDTMLHPRPYQADLDPALTPDILLRGSGMSFHPQAVESLLQLDGIH